MPITPCRALSSPPVIRLFLIVQVPDASNQRRMPLSFCPVDGFSLRLGRVKHIVPMIFDYIIFDRAAFGAALRKRFDINARHASISPEPSYTRSVKRQVAGDSCFPYLLPHGGCYRAELPGWSRSEAAGLNSRLTRFDVAVRQHLEGVLPANPLEAVNDIGDESNETLSLIQTSCTTRKPICPVEVFGVLDVRAALRYRKQ